MKTIKWTKKKSRKAKKYLPMSDLHSNGNIRVYLVVALAV